MSVADANTGSARVAGAPPSTPRARLFAYYLPQFHPIPQNNEWWGDGFTEWTNVTRARPMFRGHVQPRLPRDLGYYDLRVPETREHQALLARESGIEGFCYWHYWFGGGQRILERPFDEVLSSGRPDFPFCLAWANQSWTGIWHGAPGRVLVEQRYVGRDDEKRHFDHILPALSDRRYSTVDGKPIFLVLDPGALPDAAAFVDHWRRLADAAGLPGLYLIGMSNDLFAPFLDAFDAVTPYGPGDYLDRLQADPRTRAVERVVNSRVSRRVRGSIPGRRVPPRRYSYRKLVEGSLAALPPGDRFYPCVLPGWDNTPRSGSNGVVVQGSSPELFEHYLAGAIDKVADRPPDHRLVFIKAWNEWAEGNYLEPDQIHGRQFLDAVARATAVSS